MDEAKKSKEASEADVNPCCLALSQGRLPFVATIAKGYVGGKTISAATSISQLEALIFEFFFNLMRHIIVIFIIFAALEISSWAHSTFQSQLAKASLSLGIINLVLILMTGVMAFLVYKDPKNSFKVQAFTWTCAFKVLIEFGKVATEFIVLERSHGLDSWHIVIPIISILVAMIYLSYLYAGLNTLKRMNFLREESAQEK